MTWWQRGGQAFASEFVDLFDAEQIAQLVVRLALAAVLGGLMGFEREQAGKAAGVRTHMMVALGAALFVLVPFQAGMELADLSRVLQGLIAGIGFLGAGAILKASEQLKVHGLTTAAGIWMTAAIGMTVGIGRGTSAILATALSLLVLAVLPRIEARLR